VLWGYQQHIQRWGQLGLLAAYLPALLAATSFSNLEKQDCVLAAYLVLGAALSVATYFSILGKQGCVMGVSTAYSALRAALLAACFPALLAATSFSIFGKRPL
jgi:hypothetical protein